MLSPPSVKKSSKRPTWSNEHVDEHRGQCAFGRRAGRFGRLDGTEHRTHQRIWCDVVDHRDRGRHQFFWQRRTHLRDELIALADLRDRSLRHDVCGQLRTDADGPGPGSRGRDPVDRLECGLHPVVAAVDDVEPAVVRPPGAVPRAVQLPTLRKGVRSESRCACIGPLREGIVDRPARVVHVADDSDRSRLQPLVDDVDVCCARRLRQPVGWHRRAAELLDDAPALGGIDDHDVAQRLMGVLGEGRDHLVQQGDEPSAVARSYSSVR